MKQEIPRYPECIDCSPGAHCIGCDTMDKKITDRFHTSFEDKPAKIKLPGTVIMAIRLFMDFGQETSGECHNGYYAKGGSPYDILERFLKENS